MGHGPSIFEHHSDHHEAAMVSDTSTRLHDHEHDHPDDHDNHDQQTNNNTNKNRKRRRFDVGDIVRINESSSNHHHSEGVIVERVTNAIIRVDFGDVHGEFDIFHCDLILRSDEYELVHQLNADGTLDILMDGDDPEDIERKVPKKNITKVMTRRALVLSRWRSAAAAVIAANSMVRGMHSHAHFHGYGYEHEQEHEEKH
eukprot:gene30820-40123_t